MITVSKAVTAVLLRNRSRSRDSSRIGGRWVDCRDRCVWEIALPSSLRCPHILGAETLFSFQNIFSGTLVQHIAVENRSSLSLWIKEQSIGQFTARYKRFGIL